MSAPSLRTVSDRHALVGTKRTPLVGHVAYPLPKASLFEKSNMPKGGTFSQKTRSIKSDDSVAPSSCISVSATQKFNLEESFPSILSTSDFMRAAPSSKNVDHIRSLSRVFSTCLQTIIYSMDDLPYGVRLNPVYEVAKYGVVFTGDLFSARASKLCPEEHPGQTADRISMVLELMDMTIASLRSFLQIAERIYMERKPLPKLPPDPSLFLPNDASADEEPIPLIAELSDTENDTPQFHSYEEAYSTDASLEKKKESRSGIIRRIIGRGSSYSKAHLFSIGSKSSFTLVDHSAQPSLHTYPDQSYRTEVKSRPPDMPYVLRQSAIFYLADPYCPEIDVDMPLPTGPTVAIRLDHEGGVKAASLPALVRLLTSRERVLNQEFISMIFICFRYFTTPLQFFQELVKRFDEQPPCDLNPAQLRVWTREAMSVHIRIGKAILIWLDLYWKPASDYEVLENLEAFTLDHLISKLPQGLVECILQELGAVRSHEPICRRARKAKNLMWTYGKSMTTAPPPTNFEVSIDTTLDTTSQILAFDTPTGREEFARQLTLKISEQFQLVDPEDAVVYWRTNEDSEAGRTLQAIVLFERSLCLWVTHTVLEQSTLEDRGLLLEFWLDVAMCCLRLRNFSSANCIFGGVASAAIKRMKLTVLRVSIHGKHKFRALDRFFGGHDNFIDYRHALASVQPTIPLIAPLNRDVTTALAVVPTAIGCTDESKDKNLINLCSYRVITKTVQAMESCLIPYKLIKNDQFQAWIDELLAKFPPDLDCQITDKFYLRSSELETKEPLLNYLTEPWSYNMAGTLHGTYTLHELPALPNPLVTSHTSKLSRYIPTLLKRA